MKTKDFLESMRQRIDQHCESSKISPTKFGILALKDPSAYKRLGNMTIGRLARVEKYLDKNASV
jgi:hypothetical protein